MNAELEERCRETEMASLMADSELIVMSGVLKKLARRTEFYYDDLAEVESTLRLYFAAVKKAVYAESKYITAWKEHHAALDEDTKAAMVEQSRERAERKGEFAKKQSIAHSMVADAVRRGTLTRPSTCSECGVQRKPVAHHDSYDRPLDVRWLCGPCHGKWHAEHGRAECTASA